MNVAVGSSSLAVVSCLNRRDVFLRMAGELAEGYHLVIAIVIDYIDKFPEAREIFRKALADGKLKIEEGEQVVKTKFEDIPKTWLMLYSGGNQGKLVTALGECLISISIAVVVAVLLLTNCAHAELLGKSPMYETGDTLRHTQVSCLVN